MKLLFNLYKNSHVILLIIYLYSIINNKKLKENYFINILLR